MLDTLRHALQLPDLRRRILFTAAVLAIFRLGSYVPVPGVDASALADILGANQSSVFGLLNLFAGGALGRFTVFALGVMPYITASIVMQLLTAVVPQLEQLAKEGVEGRKKIAQYTRYGTLGLAFIQSIAYSALAGSQGVVTGGGGFFQYALITITLVAGTMVLMWLGEKIQENGIGNGISLIIFAGIVARIPNGLVNAVQAVGDGGISPFSVVVFLVLAIVIVMGIIVVQEGQRRIPVQYPKRVVGRRMYGGQSTHIPFRVNQAGVIPIIFASSILIFPLTIGQFVPALSGLAQWIGPGTWGYNLLYVIFVFFFTYFYTAVTVNPTEVADNMKKYGGFIPGLRPGRPTAEYLDRVLSRITLAGASFLAIIAVLPYLMAGVTRMPTTFLFFGGTSLLIVVGVALDTMKQVEGQLTMRQYEGFVK